MSTTGVGTYAVTEARTVRRRMLVRAGAAVVLGPVAATAGYELAGAAGVVEPLADPVELALLALVFSLVGVATLVVLSLLVERPVFVLSLAGGVVWAIVSVLLEETAGGAWLGATVVGACVVAVPLAVVIAVTRRPIAVWRVHRAQLEA